MLVEQDVVMIQEDGEPGDVIPTNPKLSKDLLPWVEKYRPNSLEELIAHEEIINICNFDSTLFSF